MTAVSARAAEPDTVSTTPVVTGGWRSVTMHLLLGYRRVWFGSVISTFLAPLLYLAGLGFGLGLLVDRGSGGIAGVPYAVFVAPGVLAVTAVQVASGESSFPVMAAIKWVRTYHGMLATPLRVRDIVIGHQVFVLLRVASAMTAFLLVAGLLGTARSWWALAAVPMATLGGMAFSTCCFAWSARLDNDRGLMMMFRFVVAPMSLFAGTFFPVEQLPGWLQPVAWATPLWHAVDACRALMLGTATVGGVLAHIVYLSVWLVAGLWLSVRVLTRRMVV